MYVLHHHFSSRQIRVRTTPDYISAPLACRVKCDSKLGAISFTRDRKNRGPMIQQAEDGKEPFLSETTSLI